MMDSDHLKRRVSLLLAFYIVALLLAGLSAIPIGTGMEYLNNAVGVGSPMETTWPALAEWITYVHQGVIETEQKYPFIFYGTDWLAFGHFVLAIAFIGPLRNPVRNIWVIELGMIACVLVLPYALVFGYLRGIPFFWRLLDGCFGVFGIIPLWLCRKWVKQLAAGDAARS
jgi:hypothetical protein